MITEKREPRFFVYEPTPDELILRAAQLTWADAEPYQHDERVIVGPTTTEHAHRLQLKYKGLPAHERAFVVEVLRVIEQETREGRPLPG